MTDIYPFLFSDPAEEERQDRQRWKRQHEQEDARRKQRDSYVPMSVGSLIFVARDNAKVKLGNAQYSLMAARDSLNSHAAERRRARAEVQAITLVLTAPASQEDFVYGVIKSLLENARQRHADMDAQVTHEIEALNRSRELNRKAHREAVVQLILQRSAERAIEQIAGSGAWGHSDLPKHVAKAMAPHVRDELGKAACHRAALEKKIHEG